MDRILALQGLTDTSLGRAPAGSAESNYCSSVTQHCSTESNNCPKPRELMMVAW